MLKVLAKTIDAIEQNHCSNISAPKNISFYTQTIIFFKPSI